VSGDHRNSLECENQPAPLVWPLWLRQLETKT